jgi:predicted short-subunit dehydrogenase-like oxidoreductase (DUF2520 family)
MALPVEPPARLRVGVVGTGRVGTVLAAALARAGHSVVGVTAGSIQSQRRVDQLLPGVARMPADDVVHAAGLVLLTVPDDVLRGLVAGLASADVWQPGQLLVHTSGAHGIGVLDAAAARGVIPLALHPAMTFAGRPEDLDRLAGASFGVTAPEEFRAVAETLVYEMGGDPVWVPELARPMYHAALTTGSNHLVTLVNDALDLLDHAGVEEPARLIAPLLSAALDNALRLRDGALTGPVSRGDAATVAAHIATLRKQAPVQVASYIAMARRTAQRAVSSGRISASQAAAVESALEAS